MIGKWIKIKTSFKIINCFKQLHIIFILSIIYATQLLVIPNNPFRDTSISRNTTYNITIFRVQAFNHISSAKGQILEISSNGILAPLKLPTGNRVPPPDPKTDSHQLSLYQLGHSIWNKAKLGVQNHHHSILLK